MEPLVYVSIGKKQRDGSENRDYRNTRHAAGQAPLDGIGSCQVALNRSSREEAKHLIMAL
jgi:hypothetical protein